ncbi:MAG: hypothetical protein P4L75_06355 [Clostridia bacterium]|nr:hypothetical protein [Clostridia bacterium]MDR3644809.1 hypothetical protein [Clostridia bacterium]
MNTVLLYGAEKDMQITNTLLAAVRATGGSALHITSRTVSMIPPQAKAPDYLILDGFHFENLHVGKGIVVFRQGISVMRQAINIPNEFCAIVDPANAEAVNALRKSCMQTITCGMSRRDTVTFSSLGSGEAVISLQRALQSLDGSAVEPRELPVRFGAGHGEYALLACVAALLLCGGVPEGELSLCQPNELPC